PRTPALAQLAADAAFQVDVDEALQHRLILARDLVNAIDRTDLDAGLAAGAVVRVDDGELRWKLLACFAGALGHGQTSFSTANCGLSAFIIGIRRGEFQADQAAGRASGITGLVESKPSQRNVATTYAEPKMMRLMVKPRPGNPRRAAGCLI